MCVLMGLSHCFEIEYQVKGEGASHALHSHAGEAPSHFQFAFTAKVQLLRQRALRDIITDAVTALPCSCAASAP